MKRLELHMHKDGKGAADLSPAMRGFAREVCLSEKGTYQLTLVLDELISNILSYGYDDPEEHEIRVNLSVEGDELSITVTDNSKPFNPLVECECPELNKPLEERRRQIGGMGVHIIRSIMDNVTYKYEDGKNILQMAKTLTPECKA